MKQWELPVLLGTPRTVPLKMFKTITVLATSEYEKKIQEIEQRTKFIVHEVINLSFFKIHGKHCGRTIPIKIAPLPTAFTRMAPQRRRYKFVFLQQ